jgi:hypothetical protein
MVRNQNILPSINFELTNFSLNLTRYYNENSLRDGHDNCVNTKKPLSRLFVLIELITLNQSRVETPLLEA